MQAFSIAMTPDLVPLRRPKGGGGISGGIVTWVAAGDSIINAMTGKALAVYEPAHTGYGAAGYALAVLGQPLRTLRNDRAMNGAPNYADMDFGWDGITAEAFLNSATVVEAYAVGAGGTGWTPAETRTPAALVAAADADAVLVLIGTNDLTGQTVATALTRLDALIRALRGPGGKRVFVGTVLPRPSIQAKVDAFNAALPGLAAAAGCVVVPWHVPLMSGGAQIAACFTDGLHPNATGAARMGMVLAEVLTPHIGGRPFVAPVGTDARWLTANPDRTTDANADGLADGITATSFSDETFELETIAGEVWQKITEADEESTSVKGLAAPAVTGATLTDLIGTGRTVRGVCRYEIVSGNITRIRMQTRIWSGTDLLAHAGYYDGEDTATLPLPAHAGLMVTEPMTVPADSVGMYHQLYFAGNGVIRVRQFGVLLDP
jgi:lysophospholipase L1-like esterase